MKKKRAARKPDPAAADLHRPVWEKYGFQCVLAILVFLGILSLVAGDKWTAMARRLYLDLPILLGWIAAAFGIGSRVFRWLRKNEATPPQLDGAPHFIATRLALGFGIISLLVLLLGLAGWLNRIVAWGLLAGGWILLVLDFLKAHRTEPNKIASILDRKPSPQSWLYFLALPILAIVVLCYAVPPGLLWGSEPNGYDVVEYHLQVPREWYEADRIVPLHHNAFSFFPFNVEMHYLLGMHLCGGPWRGMYLAQLMHVAFVIFAVIGIYEMTPGRKWIGFLTAISVPWLILLAPVAYNEGGLLLFGTLSIGWVASIIKPDETSSIALKANFGNYAIAGLMAGFACGVKLTGGILIIAIIPAIVLCNFKSTTFKTRIQNAGIFLIAAMLVFSPWLIRNTIWTGNPIFPEGMSLLGKGHFTDHQVQRWHQAHSATPAQQPLSAKLKAFKDEVLFDWRFGYLLIPVALVAAVRSRRNAQLFFLIWFILVLSIFWIFFTHLQSRFFVLAIPALCMLVAMFETNDARYSLPIVLLLQAVFGVKSTYVQAIEPCESKQMFSTIGLDGFVELKSAEPGLEGVFASKSRILLIGDAKAFWYPVAMDRLKYRTVFDVDTGELDIISGWLINDKNTPKKPFTRQPGDVVVIDYSELDRFHKTYKHIPRPATQLESTGRVIMIEKQD